MAKQGGIVFFDGTIGGINFYYRKGVPTARAAGGGFTRNAIKKGANMVRVRESNSEFGGCSIANKVFKQSIRPFLIGYKDGTLHSRLMKMFLKVKDCDTHSKRGERTVVLGMGSENGKRLLKNFVFTPKRPELFPCTYGFDWNTLTFSVTGFQANQVRFPVNATYMEVVFGIIRYDFEADSYTQIIEAPLVIERDFSGDNFNIMIPGLPAGTGILYAVARVAFYQEVNGVGYILPGGNAFGLEVLSVVG